jgi:hypothetical protein
MILADRSRVWKRTRLLRFLGAAIDGSGCGLRAMLRNAVDNASFLWTRRRGVLPGESAAVTLHARQRFVSDGRAARSSPAAAGYGRRKPNGSDTADTKFDAALASRRGRAQIEFSC